MFRVPVKAFYSLNLRSMGDTRDARDPHDSLARVYFF